MQWGNCCCGCCCQTIYLQGQVQFCRLLSFSTFHLMLLVLLQRGENEHQCYHPCPILFKCCCFPLLAMLLFALPLTAGSTGSFLLPALGNTLAVYICASPTMATNVCTALKTAMTELVCQISHLMLLGRVITPPPHPTVAMSTSVENGTINGVIVLDVLWMWPPRDSCTCPDHPCLREDAVWHVDDSRLGYKISAWSDFRRFILDVATRWPLFV